ncbi:DUF1836 domain-containing protein [Amphibacillus indicireducens]|uniref:DUF1836 domain-containing protein n=1 Tax=Amphibacillus indicireducens TaxID=1076330 RepID=A0ABP7V1N0_9BACI
MDQLEKLVASLHLDDIIIREEIPKIDLYVDQVTQLFEGIYAPGKRDEKEKILTKTMINNYAKGDLLFPIKNKRYSKEHIMFIQFIYQLKASLSISDTKTALQNLNDSVVAGGVDLDKLYDQYVELMGKQVEDLTQFLPEINQEAEQVIEAINFEDQDYLRNLFLIFSFVHKSNMYRKLAERLTDQLTETVVENDQQKN